MAKTLQTSWNGHLIVVERHSGFFAERVTLYIDNMKVDDKKGSWGEQTLRGAIDDVPVTVLWKTNALGAVVGMGAGQNLTLRVGDEVLNFDDS